MRSGGVELVVGVVTDVDWGPLLAVGLGGVLVEVLDDVALRRLPVDAGEIRGMFDQLRGRAVLDGVRGGAAVDFDAAVAAVLAVARLAEALGPDLESLEINPLRVAVDGVEALDAVLTWRSRVDDDAPEPQPEGTRR
jgi:succinyl-CoA synthetase beta subunit